MRVSLIKKSIINNINLPEQVSGNYWITDYDENGNEINLINIEAKNGAWTLISNDEVFIIDDNKRQEEIALENYSFYSIKSNISKQLLIIYCCPSYDESISYYKVTQQLLTGLTIGRGSNCDIVYDLEYINNVQARITFSENKLTIKDENSKYGIYINNNRLIGTSEIDIGDVIFIMGLKMIILKLNGIYILALSNFNNVKTNNIEKISINIKEQKFEEPTEEQDMTLYNKDSYFHRNPRFINLIKEREINVDSPPTKQEQKDTPMILTIGPMITMSMTSVVMLYSSINNIMNSNGRITNAIPQMVICFAMLASCLLWPMITRKYEKKKRKEEENNRQMKYIKYINSIKQEINNECVSQKEKLNYNYRSMEEYQNIILNKDSNLWNKRKIDEDFLNFSLGHGNTLARIKINFPDEHFSMMEDNLKDLALNLSKEPKLLENVPISYSFRENNILSIIGNDRLNSSLIKNIILQLVALHSYDNLKIVLFTNKTNEYKWEFLKTMPHVFSDDKKIRFFATTEEEYQTVCYYLDRVLQDRKEDEKHDFSDYYIIITDSFLSIRNYDFIKNVLTADKIFEFGIIILTDKITSLPEECHIFIETDKECHFFNSDATIDQKFVIDSNQKVDMEKISKTLLNIPIEYNSKTEGKIPETLGFLEMYDVGRIEQLNALNRWKRNNPIRTLQAPIGFGKSGEKINLDLHEKAHGPHGLIAGSTGSGKSEFIITYILSMALNYHPLEVQFILIDYKGGGLAGAFENQTTGVKLPHLVGTITNLDANEIKRSLASVESELKRRQKLFNKAREISKESTIDIYKYQRLYREGVVDAPVSHLFIISDEFAELKQQQPEFMQQLIQTARIGRSLGVHLILATQKPAGVVDSQIWSNTRFRVCMRVQEKQDSMDVIKQPDAALLKQTGRFYLQVGFNEIFVLGQAAWAGGQYFPQEKIKKHIDSNVLVVNNVGEVIKTFTQETKKENVKSYGEELGNIIKYISDIAKSENIKVTPLWLPKLKEFITVEALEEKYNYEAKEYILDPIVGEYDIPNKQEQHLLTMPFSTIGNALVYGVTGSGKENLIITTLYSLMKHHSPKEINYYIIDFGAEVFKCFNNSPIVGDIMYINDIEKITNLFKMLYEEIDKRRTLFAEYNGDYYTYCTRSNNSVANIVIALNNYEGFIETYPEFEDELNVLTRESTRYGIYFLVTTNTPTSIRYKLKQNFPLIYCLQQNNDDDFNTILGNVMKNYPSKIYGRGIFKGSEIHEFQTATVTEKEEINDFIKDKCVEYQQKYNMLAKHIPVLPEKVTYKDIKDVIGKTNELVIGIDKDTLEIATFNFYKNLANVVTSNDIEPLKAFIEPLMNQIMLINKSALMVINTDSDVIFDDNTKKYYKYIDTKFDEVFTSLSNYLLEQNNKFKENNFNKDVLKDNKHITCIIVGVSKFKEKLSAENQNKFNDIFNLAKDLNIINYIFVDTIDKIKQIETEMFYKPAVNQNEGIFVGTGINDQYQIKITGRHEALRDELPKGFCFVVKRGKPYLVKFVESLKIK